jgi:hypothetical protein
LVSPISELVGNNFSATAAAGGVSPSLMAYLSLPF